MKKFVTILLFATAFCFVSNSVSAKGVIIYSNGEKIEVAQTLPDSITIDEQHINLGVMYEQFSIFWIPMWNYGETKYVFINEKKDTYYDLQEEDLEYLRSEYGVKIPETPSICFWNKIGGKLIWLAVIAACIYGYFLTRKDDKDEDAAVENGQN
jgi:hypothetical protein